MSTRPVPSKRFINFWSKILREYGKVLKDRMKQAPVTLPWDKAGVLTKAIDTAVYSRLPSECSVPKITEKKKKSQIYNLNWEMSPVSLSL